MRTTRLFKALITYSFLMMITLSLNSCFIGKAIESKKARKEFTEENNAIPPSFGKKNTVLLCVLKGRNSYDKYLKKAVEQNYKGEYILINKSDLSSDKYSDKNKFRYVFDFESGSSDLTYHNSSPSSPYSTVNSNNSVNITYKRFSVNDRLVDRKYESGAEFGNFGNAMKIYMENLEVKRTAIK